MKGSSKRWDSTTWKMSPAQDVVLGPLDHRVDTSRWRHVRSRLGQLGQASTTSRRSGRLRPKSATVSARRSQAWL